MNKLFMLLAFAISTSGCAVHAHSHGAHSHTTTVRVPPPPPPAARPIAPGPNCTWVRAHASPTGQIVAQWVCGPRSHIWVSGTYVTVRVNGIPTRRYVSGYYRHPRAPRVHRYHRQARPNHRPRPPRRR